MSPWGCRASQGSHSLSFIIPFSLPSTRGESTLLPSQTADVQRE